MLVSIYSNKSLIYIFSYAIFKFIFYVALTNYFSSFLYPLYLISISKIFSFILYIIKNKIQSLENNDNSLRRIETQELLIHNHAQNNNINGNGRERHSQRRKKILSWIIIFFASVLEMCFYAMFNKVHEEDPNRRGYYYLMNNKFFFLFFLSVMYLGIYKQHNNKHNILAIILLGISQISIYFINYAINFGNIFFILYSFFMNVIYSVQNFIEKRLIIINDNHEKHTMYIASEEGILELVIVIILTIAVRWYFGVELTMPFSNDYTLTIKFILVALCILLSEFIRMDTLYKYNPFYICLFEEIIYISFSIYNSPEKELGYLTFHLVNIIAIFIFIEVIELNFCGLNQRTERFLRERELDRLNQIIEGIGSNSSESTGSNSGGNNDNNNHNNNNNNNDNQNHEHEHEIILNDDLLNLDIFDNNDNKNLLIGNEENLDDIFEESKNNNIIDKDVNISFNIGKIFDDEE